MKIPVRTSSRAAAILCWLLLSALTVFIFWAMGDRARLIRDNDNERLFNMLFTSLRSYDDFGSVIESNPMLRERIAGFGIYGDDLALTYAWGRVPPVFDEDILEGPLRRERYGRYTLPDKRGGGVKFILHTDRVLPPPMPPSVSPPPRPAPEPNKPGERRHMIFIRSENRPNAGGDPDFFNTLFSGKYLYIDIAHPAYWRAQTLTVLLFPLCELALLVLVFYIRSLYLRNREYRERIEAQKNLVVLGTAAGTLAHEIKNPLLSIRLQTGILGKLFPDAGKEELAIINEEVDRLSALTYRVNDYLREAEGEQVPLNSYDFLRNIAERLCGRNILEEASVRDGMILMDSDRARSVFENILRNALESGGPEEALGVLIARLGGAPDKTGSRILITVLDRGKGIPPAELKRVFDPFFTRKSTGTGIGLSICKRFTEAAGGDLSLENREGGGISARITLPEYILPKEEDK
ncbi:MAG: HAMP domain-containing histidine kinase [Treponema sp.]|jgi:two-component system sensor histidine kinase HydH|nr:HAMP domain-containing histidine kinase [Treponema sp.]